MSIIARRPALKPSSRKPPTEKISEEEAKKIQQRVERQREMEAGEPNPRSKSRVERAERLLCCCGVGNPEADLEPLPSQHIAPNKRTTTLQHVQEGWARLYAAVTAAGKWRARTGHSAQKDVAASPTQQFGAVERKKPIVSSRA